MGPCDFRLIELIRQNKFLYDQSDPDFRNLEKKEITWRAIAAAQGSTAEICRRRFRSLRDRFVREKRQNKEQLLNGVVSNPLWLKMMFLWDHLRPHRRFNWKQQKHKRFQSASQGTMAIQNVYTVVHVDSSGVPIPNQPVASAKYILVNSAAENSSSLNSTVAEVQGPTEVAEPASPEAPEEETPEGAEVPSDVEEQVSSEAVAEVSSDIVEHVSSKAVAEEPSDVEEDVPPDTVVVPSDVVEQESAEDVAQLIPLKAIKQESPGMVTKTFRSMSKFSKRGLQSRGKKRLKSNNSARKLPKKIKTDEVSPTKNFGSSRNPAETMASSSCNSAFCTVVKNYLDKISNPMKLSSTRIKILSLVHEEMYSSNR